MASLIKSLPTDIVEEILPLILADNLDPEELSQFQLLAYLSPDTQGGVHGETTGEQGGGDPD